MKFVQPQTEEQAAVRDGARHQLMQATNEQIDAWLTANVTTLAQARSVFALILRQQRAILRRLSQPRV